MSFSSLCVHTNIKKVFSIEYLWFSGRMRQVHAHMSKFLLDILKEILNICAWAWFLS